MRLRTILLVLLLAVPVSVAGAAASVDTLALLGHRVSVLPDGDAVLTTTIVRAAPGSGEALLPFGFDRADSFTVTGGGAAFPGDSSGAPAPLRLASRRRLLALSFGPGAAGETTLVRCRLRKFVDWAGARGGFAAYTLGHTFINDSELSLGLYRLVMDLPPEYHVRRITGTEPAYKAEDSPVPPYAVGVTGGRSFASMKTAHLRPGGRVRLGIQAEHARRGQVPLVAGIVLALLYLWFFRDIVAARVAAMAASQTPTGSR
jgi:hypothetical protein